MSKPNDIPEEVLGAKPLYCSFCGKHQDYVAVLVTAREASICDECIDECADIVAKKRAAIRTPAKAEETSK